MRHSLRQLLQNPIIKKIIYLDKLLDTQWLLYIFLLAVVFLRVPSISEPYWYGDEAIYLTVGNAINHGQQLYKDTVDHKTPIIYHLARVPSQMHFRLLLTVWMVVTTGFFYYISQLFFKKKLPVIVSTSLFVIFTTLPWLEGNIPNGELFMMGFSLVSLFLCIFFLREKLHVPHILPRDTNTIVWLFIAGIFGGLAILTKVPSLLDLGGLLLIPFFALSHQIHSTKWSQLKNPLISSGIWIIMIAAGAVLSIVISLLIAWFQGTLPDYLQYGLLYNLHYSGTWVPQLPLTWLQPATSLLVKSSFLCVWILILFILGLKKKITLSAQIALGWTGVAFFGSLLSNRPYPHYFLQLVPPLSLLAGVVVFNIQKLLDLGSDLKMHSLFVLKASITLLLTIIIGSLIWLLITQLGVTGYPTVSYYQKWYKMATKQITPQEYNNSFDALVADNNQVASFLKDQEGELMYIWGTNPVLYAQIKSIPADKFTVSFHVKDLNSYDQTLENIKLNQPNYIIMMKNEQGTFPALEAHVQSNYIVIENYTFYTLWKLRQL